MKSSLVIMFTQEDCINLLNDLPKCDIFITHSNPQYREFEEVDITPPPASFKEVVSLLQSVWRNRLVQELMIVLSESVII